MSTSTNAVGESRIRQTRLTVPAVDADVASDRLWQAGAHAVEEVFAEAAAGAVELRTVLSQNDDESRRVLGDLPASWTLAFVDVDVRPAHTWRQFAQPIEVGESLVVTPAWRVSEPRGPQDCAGSHDGRLSIEIEPGSAFGLGDHPTTRLMLAILESLPVNGAEVLDVGCGTGVLSIVAAKRGATNVVGIDIAAAACEATADNAARNGVEVAVSTTPIEGVTGMFSIVLANILAPTLIAMSADLRRVTAPGGTLVISGLIDGQADHVVDAFDPFVVVDAISLDGWAAYVLRAPTDD